MDREVYARIIYDFQAVVYSFSPPKKFPIIIITGNFLRIELKKLKSPRNRCRHLPHRRNCTRLNQNDEICEGRRGVIKHNP